MLDERELAENLRETFRAPLEAEEVPALRDAEVAGLPESESGFTVTLVDGTKFVVTVTKIEEGE